MRIRLVPASAYPLDVLTAAYNRARSDYLVPMPMTPTRTSDAAGWRSSCQRCSRCSRS